MSMCRGGNQSDAMMGPSAQSDLYGATCSTCTIHPATRLVVFSSSANVEPWAKMADGQK